MSDKLRAGLSVPLGILLELVLRSLTPSYLINNRELRNISGKRPVNMSVKHWVGSGVPLGFETVFRPLTASQFTNTMFAL